MGQKLAQGQQRIDPDRVQAFTEWPRPDTMEKLDNFIHIITYSLDYIDHGAQILQPLRAITHNHKKKEQIVWNAERNTQWLAAKEAACSIPTRNSVDPNKPVYIMTDASSGSINGSTTTAGGIAAMMFQLEDDADFKSKKIPIAFFSRKLTKPQSGWAILDTELLAIWASLERWINVTASRNQLGEASIANIVVAHLQAKSDYPPSRHSNLASFERERGSVAPLA
jgi:hypothetical protein